MAKTKKSTNDHRVSSLKELFSKLDQTYGVGTGLPIPEREVDRTTARIPTGSLMVDYVTCGGIPKGRITEMFGNESSGKTTLALSVLAQAQQRGEVAAFIDAEHTFDPAWAVKLGVDVSQMLYHDPMSGEEALNVVETMVRSEAVGLIVVDSVSALIPEAELKGQMGESHMGKQPMLMSQAMRKLVGSVDVAQCALIFINQLREKMSGTSYGPNETTTGGRALKFYSTLRMDIRRAEQIKSGTTVLGHQMRVTAVKNKLGPAFRRAFVPLLYATGLDPAAEMVELALSAGLIQQRGAWFSAGDERLGQGKEAAVTWMREHSALTSGWAQKLSQFLETGEVYA